MTAVLGPVGDGVVTGLGEIAGAGSGGAAGGDTGGLAAGEKTDAAEKTGAKAKTIPPGGLSFEPPEYSEEIPCEGSNAPA